MRVHHKNRPLFALPKSHPVIRFFDACSQVPWPDSWQEGVEQEWDSVIEGRKCTFSGFVYSYICFDIVLEGWITRPPILAKDEIGLIDRHLPRLRGILHECEAAATKDKNSAVLAMIRQIKSAFDLWEEAIRYRITELHFPRTSRAKTDLS